MTSRDRHAKTNDQDHCAGNGAVHRHRFEGPEAFASGSPGDARDRDRSGRARRLRTEHARRAVAHRQDLSGRGDHDGAGSEAERVGRRGIRPALERHFLGAGRQPVPGLALCGQEFRGKPGRHPADRVAEEGRRHHHLGHARRRSAHPHDAGGRLSLRHLWHQRAQRAACLCRCRQRADDPGFDGETGRPRPSPHRAAQPVVGSELRHNPV